MEEPEIDYYECGVCDYESEKQQFHCGEPMMPVYSHEFGEIEDVEEPREPNYK